MANNNAAATAILLQLIAITRTFSSLRYNNSLLGKTMACSGVEFSFLQKRQFFLYRRMSRSKFFYGCFLFSC